MIKKAGGKSIISSGVDEIRNAEKIIIPGVGSFGYGMDQLERLGLIEVLNQKALKERIPILGICLGFQLMTSSSEEGGKNGLGWFDAKTVLFKPNPDSFKIPHMGWNEVSIRKSNPLLSLNEFYKFYFVHSYYVIANKEEDILSTTRYYQEFISGMCVENLYGVQFHPEKSHRFGLDLIRNYINL
ncbi:MAG: imidazole glycerol phosphate synthase subunit HisH [Bacteroidales bacterium]|nr:imidazole glycerol phosphate synthase subunit HisH [Bacteroidales bacterium]